MSKMLYLTIAIIYISVQTSGKSVSRRDSSRGGFAAGLFQQEISHLQRKIVTQGQRIQLLENDNTGCKSQLNILEWKLQNIDKKVASLEEKHQQDINNINTNCQCSSNQPGHGLNQAGPDINLPGPGINQPGPSINQPGPSINYPGPSINHPGYPLNQPGPGPNQPGVGSLPGYGATTEPGISGSLDYLHIEEEVADSSSGWTQLVNGSYNYIRESPHSQQSPASSTTISPVLDSGNASGQWVWSDSANKWEWKLFPRQMLKSLPDISVLHNNGDLQQQQRQLQQQAQHSQSQHQIQQQHQIQSQHQQQQQQQQQQQHQNQHQQQGQNQQPQLDIDLSSVVGDSDCCWFQLPNSTWVRKSSSWFRAGSRRVHAPGNGALDGAVHAPGNGALHAPGNSAVDGAVQPAGSGSSDTGWKKLPNGSYMRKWSSWSSWSGGKPCC